MEIEESDTYSQIDLTNSTKSTSIKSTGVGDAGRYPFQEELSIRDLLKRNLSKAASTVQSTVQNVATDIVSDITKVKPTDFSNDLTDYNLTDRSTMRKQKKMYNSAFEVYPPNDNSNVTVKRFDDYRPENNANKEYFNQIIMPDPDGIAVIIPFYNEPSHELQQTLNSIYIAFEELKKRSSAKWANKKLHICLIQDGWHKAHHTMQTYLKTLFQKKISQRININGIIHNRLVDWADFYPELKAGFNNPDSNAMFILEKGNYELTEINYQESFELDRKPMSLTLLVKANNRHKHNSHQWFIDRNGFAEATNAEYLLLTDAFTLFSKTCLYHLIEELDNDEKLSSITGRQIVMTEHQQGCDNEKFFSLARTLRMVQLGDFELANCVYNGAFSLGGMLPVIPGPCGVYRRSILCDDRVRRAYFSLVNASAHETGIIVGNLKIAEDRVLSYDSVVYGDHSYQGFNPLARFGFEAETNLEKFMLQRRRWINGSIAGYIYLLLINFREFYNWKTSICRKIYVWILLVCQLITYLMVGISPGISLKILYYGVDYFANYYDWDIDLELTGIFVLIWELYIFHVVTHNKEKFNAAIVYALLIMSYVTSIVTFASLFHYVFISTRSEESEFAEVYDAVLIMGVIVFVAPFLLSLMLSGRGHSFLYMIKSYIVYVLFLPMLIAWFGSYSYSRIWDLSWGNRPTGEMADVLIDQREIMARKFKDISVKVLIFLLICNIIIFFLPLIAQVIIVGSFFAIVIYQMFFSMLYCLIKINYKIRVMINNFITNVRIWRRDRRRKRNIDPEDNV